jgi:hypothetical protein
MGKGFGKTTGRFQAGNFHEQKDHTFGLHSRQTKSSVEKVD